MFADQDQNGKIASTIGIGKVLEILDLPESQLEETILEVLENPRLDYKLKCDAQSYAYELIS